MKKLAVKLSAQQWRTSHLLIDWPIAEMSYCQIIIQSHWLATRCLWFHNFRSEIAFFARNECLCSIWQLASFFLYLLNCDPKDLLSMLVHKYRTKSLSEEVWLISVHPDQPTPKVLTGSALCREDNHSTNLLIDICWQVPEMTKPASKKSDAVIWESIENHIIYVEGSE
jgi:hypothetical protein